MGEQSVDMRSEMRRGPARTWGGVLIGNDAGSDDTSDDQDSATASDTGTSVYVPPHARQKPQEWQPLDSLSVVLSDETETRAMVQQWIDRGKLPADSAAEILEEACLKGYASVVRMLVNHGAIDACSATDRRVPLIACARRNNIQCAQILLSQNVDPSLQSRRGFCALAAACEAGHVRMTKLLLQYGAEVNSRDSNFATPLFRACSSQRAEVVEILLDRGADVELASVEQHTPLHVACLHLSLPIVAMLLRAGANVNAVTATGRSPLHMCLHKSRTAAHRRRRNSGEDLKVAQLLLDHGCDVNLADEKGWTPLFRAIRLGSHEMINELLAAGSSVSVEDARGYTPLHVCAAHGRRGIALQLLQVGANVNARDRCAGTTPFFLACKHHRVVMCELLLEHGADIGIPSLDLVDPLDLLPAHVAASLQRSTLTESK